MSSHSITNSSACVYDSNFKMGFCIAQCLVAAENRKRPYIFMASQNHYFACHLKKNNQFSMSPKWRRCRPNSVPFDSLSMVILMIILNADAILWLRVSQCFESEWMYCHKVDYHQKCHSLCDFLSFYCHFL